MAKKTGKTSILAEVKRAGGKKAWEKHKKDETRMGAGGNLPEGIEGGIAQLSQAFLSRHDKGNNQGKPFFFMMGKVKTPEEVKGLNTTFFEPLYETPGRSRESVEDHLDRIMNELRKLGVLTAELDLDDLEDVLKNLEEEAPYFRFRTWKGTPSDQYPNPRVNEEWRGITEWKEDDDEEVVDESGDSEEEEEVEFGKEEEAAAEEDTEEEEAEESTESDEEADYATLGEAADEGDDEAETQLTGHCKLAGIDPDEYETWAEVAQVLSDSDSEEGEEVEVEEEETDEAEPEKEDVFLYKPPKAKAPVECEVTAVFKSKKTVNLKDANTGRTYKSVPWAKLEG